MFTKRQHFRRPSLHETISHHCLQKTRQTRTVPTSTFMPVQSTEMSIPCKNQHLLLVWYVSVRRACRTFAHTLTECLSKKEKCSTSRRGAGASYQTTHPGISARAIAFGRSWPFAAFCYRPCLLVRHWGRDMSAPKPYVTNPTPTHSSIRPPLSLQFNVRFRWLIYLREKSFYLSYGKHCSRGMQRVRTRLAKGNIHKCIQLSFIPEFRVTARATILGDITFTAKIHSIHGYITKFIEKI